MNTVSRLPTKSKNAPRNVQMLFRTGTILTKERKQLVVKLNGQREDPQKFKRKNDTNVNICLHSSNTKAISSKNISVRYCLNCNSSSFLEISSERSVFG